MASTGRGRRGIGFVMTAGGENADGDQFASPAQATGKLRRGRKRDTSLVPVLLEQGQTRRRHVAHEAQFGVQTLGRRAVGADQLVQCALQHRARQPTMAVGLQAHLLFQAGGDQSRLPAQATDFGKIIKGLERPAFPPPQVLVASQGAIGQDHGIGKPRPLDQIDPIGQQRPRFILGAEIPRRRRQPGGLQRRRQRPAAAGCLRADQGTSKHRRRLGRQSLHKVAQAHGECSVHLVVMTARGVAAVDNCW
jgi:hypothetical protein